MTQLDTSGTVVGLFDGMSYEESRIPMRPGDILVAFSDGVTEPENEFGEFGEDRLSRIDSTPSRSAAFAHQRCRNRSGGGLDRR